MYLNTEIHLTYRNTSYTEGMISNTNFCTLKILKCYVKLFFGCGLTVVLDERERGKRGFSVHLLIFVVMGRMREQKESVRNC